MAKIAINGLGRIGRVALKALAENSSLELVAVNDLIPPYQLAYLLNFDSIYGKMRNKVRFDEQHLYVNDRQIPVLNVREPEHLPWKGLEVDVVLECTGMFTSRHDLEKHLQAGAQCVILAAPSRTNDIPVVIPGVNTERDETINSRIISTGSCSANAISPLVEIMGRRIGIRKAITTTIQSYTAGQYVMDSENSDLRKGRSVTENFIPSATDAGKVVAKALPQFTDKINSMTIQGPVPAGCLVEITFLTERHTSVEEVNNIFCEEAGSNRYMGIVGINTEPIVSSDIAMDPRASVVDITMTQVVDGDLVRVMAWYDNEWGFINQVIREAERVAKKEMIALV